MNADLDIVIINHNTRQLSIECIESIYATCAPLQVHIVVVDNASQDDSLKAIQDRFPNCDVLPLAENLGYGAACNKALKLCKAEFILFSNSDVVYQANSLQLLVVCLRANTSIGICGPQQVYMSGRWQRSYGLLPGLLSSTVDVLALTFAHRRIQSWRFDRGWMSSSTKSVDYLDGAVLCCRRSAVDQVMGFDEQFYFFGEDVDICQSMKARGWTVSHVPLARVLHYRGATRSTSHAEDLRYLGNNQRARYRFIRKYHSDLYLRFCAILDCAYFAELMLLNSCASLVVSGERKRRLQNKADICRHLVRICAEELERE